VLIVEDDPVALEFTRLVVKQAGYLVQTVSSGKEALEVAPHFSPEIVVVDYLMPEMNGIETVQALRPHLPDTLMVLVTGFADIEVAANALRESMFDFLLKPFTAVELRHCLRRAEEHREALLRARRQENLLFVISHELRSPLQAPLRLIDSFLSGVYGEIPARQRDRLERVASGIRTQSRLVNNLVNLTYLESGRFQVQLERRSLTAVIQEVVNAFELRAQDLNVRLVWKPPRDPYRVVTDAEQVKQAISNVVSNALEHTPQGKSVEITLGLVRGELRCSVRDEGCGIPAVHCRRVFERGYQVPSTTRRSGRGLGIGLFIAQEIAKALGGLITVQSTLGQGATFTFALPASENSEGGS
jgi:signal transduction histidine kinase